MSPRLAAPALADALEDTWHSLDGVCRSLGPADWAAETGCPGWTVKDVVAHVAGAEASLLGRPQPAHEVPADLPHVRNEMGAVMEVAVDFRRPWPAERVLAEFEEVTAARLAELRAPGFDLEAAVASPFGGETTLGRLLPIRVLDSYADEQDVRRAVGRPGHLDGPAFELSVARLVAGDRQVVPQRVPDAIGSVVVLEIDGAPHVFDYRAEAPSAEPLGEGDRPAATVSMPAGAYLAAACGRADVDRSAISVTGDEGLGWAVAGALGLTP